MANASIPLQVQPIRIPDPLEGYQRALTLKTLLGQQNLQGLQERKLRRGLESEEQVEEFARQSGGDLMTLRDLLVKGGRFREAQEIESQMLARSKAEREATGSQLDVDKKQSDLMAQLAGSVAFASPDQQAAIYPSMAAEWKRLGLPNSDKVPDQWDPVFLPHLQRIARGGLNTQQAMERADYAALGVPGQPAAPATMSQYVNQPEGVPHFTGPKAQKLPYSEDAVAMMTQLPPDEAAMQSSLATSGQGAAPAVGVDNANRPKITPDDYRKEADRLEAMGTKVSAERAKVYRDEANRLDDRIGREFNQAEQIRVREEAQRSRELAQKSRGTDDANKLRDDFTRASKVFVDTRDAFTRISDAAQDPSAAGDLALIFNYMKMLDPGSTVREGEFATAENSAGVEGRVRSYYNNILRGERLNTEQRGDFVDRAERLYAGQLRNHETLEKQFKGIAERAKINPADVIIDYRPTQAKGRGPKKTGVGSGTQADPFKIKGDDGFGAVKSGEYFTGPDGQLRRKP